MIFSSTRLVILVSLFSFIISFQNCSPFSNFDSSTNFESSKVIMDETNKKTSVRSLNQFDRGTEVFFKQCLGCHGSDVDTSEKRNINLDQLNFALRSIKDMNHLKLSEQDKVDVVFALHRDRAKIVNTLRQYQQMPREHISVCKPEKIHLSTVRRLNRREYSNTIDMLFRVKVEQSKLPQDKTNSIGYDNDGSSLFLLDGDGEKYYDLAEEISSQIVKSDISFTKCKGTSQKINSGCFQERVQTLLRYAFRRNVSGSEVNRYVKFADGELNLKGFEKVITATLASPHFLFLNLSHKNLSQHRTSRINQFDLATRLSLFLWGRTPDGILLNLANQGQLNDENVLSAQVERMIASKYSNVFVNNFIEQWLTLTNLHERPKEKTDTNFTSISSSMVKETQTFFRHVLDNNLPVNELIDADYTFMNNTMAKHYGLSRTNLGNNFVKVSYEDRNRRGLITHASYLSSSEHPGTSIIFRGASLMERLLCVSPPSTVEPGEFETENSEISEGEKLNKHSNSPECASCHTFIDPLGKSLAGFNEIGQWRGLAQANDARGNLPDGTSFDGANELMGLLSKRSEFMNCIGEHMAISAVGRKLNKDESCYIREIAIANDKNIGLRDYIKKLVKSNILQFEKSN